MTTNLTVTENLLVAPPGIQLNRGKRSESIGISFYYLGAEHRETLKLPINRKNLDFAINLRGSVLHEIATGKFDYDRRFPNSLKARRAKVEAEEKFASDPCSRTIGELAMQFLEHRRPSVKLSTYNQYNDVVKTHVLPRWEHVRAVDVVVSDIKKWILGMGIKHKTISSIILPFRAALQIAVDDEIIDRNPCERVELHKLLTREQRTKFKASPFDIDEITKILAACEHPLERSMFAFALGTGMRPCEYAVLTWGDINISTGIATISRTFVDGQYDHVGKTALAIRPVRLTKLAWDAISQRCHDSAPDQLVFPHPVSSKQWTGDRQIRGRWRRILGAAGVRYRNLYQTRHTYASSRLMLGTNVCYLATQLGHVDTKMINEVYGKWIQKGDTEQKLEALRALYTEIAQK